MLRLTLYTAHPPSTNLPNDSVWYLDSAFSPIVPVSTRNDMGAGMGYVLDTLTSRWVCWLSLQSLLGSSFNYGFSAERLRTWLRDEDDWVMKMTVEHGRDVFTWFISKLCLEEAIWFCTHHISSNTSRPSEEEDGHWRRRGHDGENNDLSFLFFLLLNWKESKKKPNISPKIWIYVLVSDIIFFVSPEIFDFFENSTFGLPLCNYSVI